MPCSSAPSARGAQGALLGVALPGIGGALHYYDQVRLARLPGAAVLAASRDALAGEGFTQLGDGGEKKGEGGMENGFRERMENGFRSYAKYKYNHECKLDV